MRYGLRIFCERGRISPFFSRRFMILSPAWQAFTAEYSLTPEQCEQFRVFDELLARENEIMNLTAITNPHEVLDYHYRDSLAVSLAFDCALLQGVIDVGTGGGFPGIPLKIRYPHLRMVLIEVTLKKCRFLDTVIDTLGLENIELFTEDWRTFLRKTSYPADLVCSRASVHPNELLRMFKPSSAYKNAQLVYWGSRHYVPASEEERFLSHTVSYEVGRRSRELFIYRCPDERERSNNEAHRATP
jgi:16S rRNA (guanine527-N7)-methyltransferase